MKKETFEKIVREYDLGSLVEEPSRVYGGYLHKSYKLVTTKNTYFLKYFGTTNNVNETIERYRIQSELEDLLKKNKVPAIYSIEFNNRKVQIVDNEVFYLFPWCDGVAIKGKDATKRHCKKIAKISSLIHSFDTKYKGKLKEVHIDWKSYMDIAKEKNDYIYNMLNENIDMLNELIDKGNKYYSLIPSVSTICHNDMDCKNVLWVNNECYLIDMECLGYGNPYLETFKHALVWSGYEEACINFKLYNYFYKKYFKYSRFKNEVDMEALYYGSFLDLEWLEVNIKRALKLVGESEEIYLMGMDQSKETIERIRHFYQNRDKIINVKY